VGGRSTRSAAAGRRRLSLDGVVRRRRHSTEANTVSQRYILTGAPGSGKTTILGALRQRGHHVVDEAATDIIHALAEQGVMEPWRRADFIERIAALQRQRQLAAERPGSTVFDRSPICTLALAAYSHRSVPPVLAAELDRITQENVYERRVFFVRNIGFVRPTVARRITYAESLDFERIHRETYRDLGYEIVDVEPGSVAERVAVVESRIET
jgi:predicted ATPase